MQRDLTENKARERGRLDGMADAKIHCLHPLTLESHGAYQEGYLIGIAEAHNGELCYHYRTKDVKPCEPRLMN